MRRGARPRSDTTCTEDGRPRVPAAVCHTVISPDSAGQPDPGADPALPPTLPRPGRCLRPAVDQSEKQTKGYAPACAKEWVRGVCEKPRVKCGECPNQAFLPVDDKAIQGHLQGRHVLGVYPLLRDETCWFLAIDFDGTGWQDDVTAFVDTCEGAGCPPAVERSRSGNGAHGWFFFAAPVAASLARNLGSCSENSGYCPK